MGALTIVKVILLGVGILACTGYPKRLLFRIALYWCFLMWAMASVLWATPSLEGAQNGVVYLQFGLTLLLSGTLARRDPLRMERLISSGVRWIDWVALTLVLRDLVMNGLPNDPEEGWLVGPRPLAVLGVVMLSWASLLLVFRLEAFPAVDRTLAARHCAQHVPNVHSGGPASWWDSLSSPDPLPTITSRSERAGTAGRSEPDLRPCGVFERVQREILRGRQYSEVRSCGPANQFKRPNQHVERDYHLCLG